MAIFISFLYVYQRVPGKIPHFYPCLEASNGLLAPRSSSHLLHRQELQDASLHFLQAVVVLAPHGPGTPKGRRQGLEGPWRPEMDGKMQTVIELDLVEAGYWSFFWRLLDDEFKTIVVVL